MLLKYLTYHLGERGGAPSGIVAYNKASIVRAEVFSISTSNVPNYAIVQIVTDNTANIIGTKYSCIAIYYLFIIAYLICLIPV